jgi:hypothetical protein
VEATLAGKGSVVTGAGHGIGRALAARLAAEGARVVVNDVDEAACHTVADELGAVPAAGDCSSEAGVAAILDVAEQHLGRVDVYLANAGIDRSVSPERPDSLQAPDEVWAEMLEVNVMAHVRAARLLVPRWLADGGGGRFVVTASAAGLLTMICPQGVQTRMLEQAGPLKDLLSHDDVRTPEEVADAWVASLADDRFLVLPHPEVGDYYARRAQDTDRWLAGMRKLQGMVDDYVGAQR